MSNQVRAQIIDKLAGADFISGEQLGAELGISRAAIAKHIQAIAEMGLDIYRVTGKGYQLSKKLDLLNSERITHYLNDKQCSNTVEVHHILDSTNSYLLRKIATQTNNGEVCLAEYQSAGRGRRGRQWISPFGTNLYLSMYRHLEQGMSAAMGLSVVAAIAVFDALKNIYGCNVELKWPNDIYLNSKKLAGILIDLEGQPLEACHCVIGIGINLSMPEASAKLVDQPWSDLSTITSHDIDRNKFAAELIIQLNKRLNEHNLTGLKDMLALWHQHDIYYNRPIKIITGKREALGISRGIDIQGALLIEQDGMISSIYGGEISLRGIS